MAGAYRKMAGSPMAIGKVSFDTMRHQALETAVGFIHSSHYHPPLPCVASCSFVRADVHITAVCTRRSPA